MALGQQQTRPVTPFEFTVTTVTGIVDAIGGFDAGSITGTSIPDGTSVPMTAIEGNADLVILVDVTSNVVTLSTEWLQDGGTGYAVSDVITVSGADLGGDGGGTATFTVDSLVGEAATVTVTDGGTGYVTGDVISAGELTADSSGTGIAGTVTASALNNDTPETGGVVSAFTITAGGTDYADGDVETVTYSGGGEVGIPSDDYVDHALYELGGNVNEYTNADLTPDGQSSYTPVDATVTPLAGTDNDPRIMVVRKADQPQLVVQKKYIDGGAVEVFAEPTTVDRNGFVVGNTVRAEDCVDQERCEANGFTWNTDGNGGSTGSNFGYCSDETYTPHADAATVNALDTASFDLRKECSASGLFWNEVEGVCYDVDTAANFSLGGAALTDGSGNNIAVSSSAQDYAKTICKQYGFDWIADTMACEDNAVVPTDDQATCEGKGHVFIAGVCYDGNSFGDGYYRTATTTQDPTDEAD